MKKKYRFLGMILSDGDKFDVQEEKPNTNKYNPSGIGTYTFNHKSWNGVEEIKSELEGLNKELKK